MLDSVRTGLALLVLPMLASCFSASPEGVEKAAPGPSTSSTARPAPAPPVPASLSQEPYLREFLQALSALPATGRVLAGQDIGHIDYRIEEGIDDYYVALSERTGALPSVLAIDYGYVLPAQGKLRVANLMLTRHCRAGGAVTVSMHPGNPFTGGDAEDRSRGGAPFSDLYTEGTDAFAAWRRQLDAIALGLAELRDQNVPVLWRPFHDMNGQRFWWTGEDAAPVSSTEFAAAWRDMFRYFTEEKRLDNLLWVFAPTTGANARAADLLYPGAAHVDITALSHPTGDLATADLAATYDRLEALGKPMGFAQVGPVTEDGSFDTMQVVKAIRQDFPAIGYFVFRHGWRSADGDGMAAIVENEAAEALMADPGVISLEKAATVLSPCDPS